MHCNILISTVPIILTILFLTDKYSILYETAGLITEEQNNL
jgi:hypothetical protein